MVPQVNSHVLIDKLPCLTSPHFHAARDGTLERRNPTVSCGWIFCLNGVAADVKYLSNRDNMADDGVSPRTSI